MERSLILQPEKEIDCSEINWCFISDYYDGPIEGLLYYKDKIWKFCCFREDVPEQSIYVILRLSDEELKHEINSKSRFEEMVGTHWSYDKNRERLPESGATIDTKNRYYESQTESEVYTPYSHKIEAWFNVSTEKA